MTNETINENAQIQKEFEEIKKIKRSRAAKKAAKTRKANKIKKQKELEKQQRNKSLKVFTLKYSIFFSVLAATIYVIGLLTIEIPQAEMTFVKTVQHHVKEIVVFENKDEVPYGRLLAKHFPADQVVNASKIMECESGNDPDRLNNNIETRDYSIGLFQINTLGDALELERTRIAQKNFGYDDGELNGEFEAWLKVPENNIKMAHYIWERNSWRSTGGWLSCSKKHGIY